MCSFTYRPGLLLLQKKTQVIATETIWPAKSKLLTIWPFTEHVRQPRVRHDLGGTLDMHFLRSLSVLGLHNANINGD